MFRSTRLSKLFLTNDDEDDDDEPPEVDVKNFRYPSSVDSFGLGKGRSSPSQRKAMGTSSKTSTTVFVCSNCGGESVQWRGRCPTCQEWNTFQEVSVQRSTGSNGVGGSSQSLFDGLVNRQRKGESPKPVYGDDIDNDFFSGGQSWLDGISTTSNSLGYENPNSRPVSIADVDLAAPESARLKIPNDDEMNEVLGGGLMKGSLILLGGDPGVGKSTLALQMAAQVASLSEAPRGIGMGSSSLATTVGPVWYVSGEETLEQIATRAQRLVNANDDDASSSAAYKTRVDALPQQLFLLSETNLNVLADGVLQAWIDATNGLSTLADDPEGSSLPIPPGNLAPSLIVIDSIQTMVCEAGGASSAGGISQVRESMALLLRLAKTTQIPILTIGHVTKTGDVAGPRMVEHMVDAVLYLEHSQSSASASQNNGNFRWLRAQKNRFGSCQTAGLYDFQEGILVPLPEGTESALAPPSEDLEGCAMGVCVEGPHRAMTVEVQALVTLPSGSYGKKTVEGGLSSARLNLLLGILQKHCQLPVAGSGRTTRDVYVNVVGCDGAVSRSQLSLATMSLDLAVTVALTSSYLRIPARGDTAFLAQVGLLGELRPLSSLDPRLLQAQRMGFSRVIVASTNKSSSSSRNRSTKWKNKTKTPQSEEPGATRRIRKYDLDIYECSTLKEALNLALVSPIPAPRRRASRQTKRTDDPSIAEKKFKGTPRSSAPGSLDDLDLGDERAILDDEEDEYDIW